MIHLTRLNGNEFILNADLIRFVERCPDTLITLVSGETIMVKEPMDEVVKRTVAYQQSKYIIPRPVLPPSTDNRPWT
ncbi:hypothetical protein FACS18942_00160 [Planctomycetales bacterium]|nr:hypothetical protein FACS18942_00160 [Planctomycetales bacterium]